MQICLPNLIFVSLIGLSMAACSSSSDSPAEQLDKITPDISEPVTQDSPFTGLWLTGCEPENANGYQSSQSHFQFDGDRLDISTQFYFDSKCSSAGDVEEMTGAYELTGDKSSGNNMLRYDFEMDETTTLKLYMRTMVLNDGAFIVTEFKSDEEVASQAVANVPLYREAEWDKIKESMQ